MRRRLVHPDHVPAHRFLHGHVIDVLRTLAAESVKTVVMSPPYYGGLRDFETAPVVWGGRENCVHQWTGYLPGKRQRWGNTDTLSAKQRSNRGSLSNVKALEKPAGRVCFNCDAWEGELGQEPACEYYVQHMLRVLFELKRVLHPRGLIFLNLGDAHAFGAEGNDTKPKDLYGTPWRVALAAKRFFWLRNAIVWEKPNGMPKSVEDFFTPTYENVFMLAKSREYDFDFQAVMVPTVDGKGLRRRRDVWRIPNRNRKGHGVHTATFPEELVEPCVKVSAKAGEVVLDCFAGSCTTAAVAARLGCHTVSIDRNREFLNAGRQRVREASSER